MSVWVLIAYWMISFALSANWSPQRHAKEILTCIILEHYSLSKPAPAQLFFIFAYHEHCWANVSSVGACKQEVDLMFDGVEIVFTDSLCYVVRPVVCCLRIW